MVMLALVLAALLVLGVVLSGCGGNGSEPAGAGSAGDATDAPAADEPGAADPTDLADGRHAAFLAAVDVSARTVTVDVVQFLTGDEARAAYADEHPDEPDGPPNDYYIRNENAQLRTLPVAADVMVSVVWLGGGGAEAEQIAFAELPDYVAGDPDPDDPYAWWAPFWFTMSDGTVTMIEEQYLP
jgi:hypothetical protein